MVLLQLVQGLVEVEQPDVLVGGDDFDMRQFQSDSITPAFLRELLPRFSTKIRRIASAAAVKKCPRESQSCAVSTSTSRR